MTDETTKTFLQIRDYAWDTNAEFQSGLRTILTSAPADHIDVLTNRAKCFYFQKKTRVPVNDMAYQEWLDGAGGRGGERGGDDDTPYRKSFAEVVELITAGKPIPGIKEIPDVVLEPPKEGSKVPVRRKPWEIVKEVEVEVREGEEKGKGKEEVGEGEVKGEVKEEEEGEEGKGKEVAGEKGEEKVEEKEEIKVGD